MGHGPARELQTATEEPPELDPAIAKRMAEALNKLDALDPEFKASRDEERDAQMSKNWGRKCKDINDHLRTVARVLIRSHQVGLDNGSFGGGRQTQPWIEETQGKLGRLMFQLAGDEVQVVSGEKLLGRGTLDEVTYDWIERMVVKWVILAAERQIPIDTA